jgi:serine-type D-Ala-D-Ala carboxypeptidase/endopeptidase (penicillin-binding protein 4)
MSVRAFAAALAATLAAAPAAAQPSASPRLAARLASALGGPGLSLERTSAVAVDLVTGRLVFSHNAELALRPASNEKLPVTYAALVRLGPAYRFHTEVLGTGSIGDDGTWTGDVYLKGFGDPTLTRWDLRALAGQVRAWGIRRIAGAVYGDESWFDRRRDAPGWKPSFVGDESPPLSALVVERGRGRPGLATALLAAAAFERALERHGIDVAKQPRVGAAPATAFPLGRDLSAPLAEIVRLVNRDSDNFVAEMLLKTLGADAGDAGTTAGGARAVREVLMEAGVPVAGVRIVDGSGLSRLDRLSAAALVALLRTAAADRALRDAYLSSLAVSGVDGTLERRMARRPTFGQVIAKTGTTQVASCLAGFVRDRFAFAILQNGSPMPIWTAQAAQDAFVTLLAKSV